MQLIQLFLAITLSALVATAGARSKLGSLEAKDESVVTASEAGAALNSDLLLGGGTDDTTVLQSILDRASKGGSVHLLIDGVALISGLNVYGNTTIECLSGGGFYLKDGSRRAIIRNVHRSRTGVVDAHIGLRGCFLNGNRSKQPGAHPESEPASNNQESDGTFITGLQFLGVNYLSIEDVTIWNARSFGVLIGNGSRVDVRNLTVDHGAPPDIDWDYLQTDGLHLKGPLQYVTVDGLKLRTGDDGLAFNADDGLTDDLTLHNEMGPYVRQGPILDVTVTNVQLMDTLFGVRFLSKKQRIDRVVISNVTGTINGPRLAIFSNYMGPGPGNIGAIEFNNISVQRSADAKFVTRFINDMENAKKEYRGVYDENNGGIPTFFNINCNVESLSLRNFTTRVTDNRPIIRIGPSGHVQQMSIDLSLNDPNLTAVPLQLDQNSRIDKLSFAIDWKNEVADIGRSAISSLGGIIGELRWIHSPPRFVQANRTNGNSIVVEFSQEVKSESFSAGVQITVNGGPVKVVKAYRDSVRYATVHYQLERSIGQKDVVFWSYNAANGFIRNMNGEDALSVGAKAVLTSEQSEQVASGL